MIIPSGNLGYIKNADAVNFSAVPQQGGVAPQQDGASSQAGHPAAAETADSVQLAASGASAKGASKGEGTEATGSAGKAGHLADKMTDAQVEKALADIMKSDDTSARSAAPQSFISDIDAFALDGCSLCHVPVMDDVAGYEPITNEAATDNYENNVKPHLKGIEKAVIKAYCTFAYRAMNNYLLGLKGSPTGTVKRACKIASGALGRFDAPQGTVLYRTSNLNELRNYVPSEEFDKYAKLDEAGQTEKLAELLNLRLSGTQVERKSFISTTIDHKFDFEDKPKVATKLYVGDNVKGIFVGADRALSKFEDEQEYLLAPGMKSTVLGVEYSEKNKGLVLHVLLGDLPEAKG